MKEFSLSMDVRRFPMVAVIAGRWQWNIGFQKMKA
jgi:hypothetical protein